MDVNSDNLMTAPQCSFVTGMLGGTGAWEGPPAQRMPQFGVCPWEVSLCH